jgi:Skp family chaperone for outer membrane proteins
VRFSPRSAAVAACLVVPVALVAQLFGQAGPPAGGPPIRPAAPAAAAGAGTHVVVIDVAFIYKNHNRFNATMLDIKTDIEQFEAYVRKKQGEFKSLGEAMGILAPNSPDFKKKEEELARMQSDLQVEVGLKRKEFLQQEARVYYRVYKEIEAEVKTFAERNAIHLVLRFNREDDMKEEDRASVLQGVNRAVVFQQGRDITELVLGKLNAGTTKPPTTPGGAGPANQNAKLRPGPVVPGSTQQR